MKRDSPNRLVDASKVGDGEGLVDKRRCLRRVLEFPASALHAVGYEPVVVERESRPVRGVEVLDWPEPSVSSVAPRRRAGDVRHQPEVRDRYDPKPWVAPGIAVGAQLLEMRRRQIDAGLLDQLSPCGLVERLAGADEPAGECPLTLRWVLTALHEQHAQLALSDGQHHHVNSDADRGIRGRVVAGKERRFIAVVGGHGMGGVGASSHTAIMTPNELRNN